jgi:photosystem II stability/assembly factor-like uncharacterized protein
MKYFLMVVIILITTFIYFLHNVTVKERNKEFIKEKAGKMPNDWFYRQRAYPYSTINHTAYLQALKVAKMQYDKILQEKESIWEFMGPTNIEGRITDIELLPGDPETIFTGTAQGGVFKSNDNGLSWLPVFDKQTSLSIGDIAISKSNPEIIYVGTGEANAGGGSLTYDGIGVFKSNDGGQTWGYSGLENCGSIGRMVVHPNNPDIVYVAAMGRLFSDNGERGVYKTTDGGITWEQKLFISDSTGAVDIVINPENPEIIYAAMWERVRRPERRSYGGATSGIYKSVDGGDTWTELTNGLPSSADDKGRIGIDICDAYPNVLYAIYADKTGFFKGIFKTENGGISWIKKDNGIDNNVYVSYGWWFGRIKADPVNPLIAYVIGFYPYKTANGGNSWSNISSWTMHVDQHAMAINPDNNNKIYIGNDGGFLKSLNGGNTWSGFKKLPITQFYTCEIDEQHPERIYGGAQDNGTNRTMTGDLDDWEQIYGGDGFRVLVDPVNNNYVYAEYQYGNLARSFNGGNNFTPATSGISYSDRFNWNTPVVFDPQNPQILYFGSQRLYKSTNRAASWNPVSGDLTNNDEQQNLVYNTLTTISVSPLYSNIIYTGSDDGNVWYTDKGGLNWINISMNLPNRWITSVTADPFEENKVYVTFSGYRWDEYQPHVLVSENNGQSWEDISSNLPEMPVNELIVDPSDTGYLYVATDAGVYFSENNGSSWNIAGSGMPIIVVNDLRLHNPTRMLYAATYGRGIYALNLDVLTKIKNKKSNLDKEVICYPNPFKNVLHIEINDYKGDLTINILNLKGKNLKTIFSGKINRDKLLFGTAPLNRESFAAAVHI